MRGFERTNLYGKKDNETYFLSKQRFEKDEHRRPSRGDSGGNQVSVLHYFLFWDVL